MALIASGAEQVGAELRRQGVTAWAWTAEDLMRSSALQSPARESENGSTTSGFCGSTRAVSDICEVLFLSNVAAPFSPRCDLAQMWRCTKLPSSRRKQHGATVILSSQVDPVDLHGTKFWYSSRVEDISRNSVLNTQREWHDPWRALAEPLRQARTTGQPKLTKSRAAPV